MLRTSLIVIIAVLAGLVVLALLWCFFVMCAEWVVHLLLILHSSSPFHPSPICWILHIVAWLSGHNAS